MSKLLIHDGYTYEIYIRPWKRANKGRFECVRWKTGIRATWEHISHEDYKRVEQIKQANK